MADQPCDADEYRQFDFWIGTWDVVDAEGTRQGTNRIVPVLDGCALEERWLGEGGSAGHSVNIYDRQTDRWHQTWVDANGLLLVLDGGLENGSMVLSGPGTSRDGDLITHRISWTSLEDGRVRQHWQVSPDDGGTWNEVFDGYYSKVE